MALIDFSDESELSRLSLNSVSSKFEDNFWGQECRGFEVLLNNLKSGSSASHHIGDYIKERVSIEKTYVKNLQKLSKTLGQATDATLGSLYPLWLVVLKTIDTVCINRDKHVISLVELGKEVAEYTSKHDDHLKGNLKGDIESAQKSLSAYRHSIDVVMKTQKTYKNSCNDVAELQLDAQKMIADPNRAKDIEKMEGKIKKARRQMENTKSEHQKAIETYHTQWKDFEQKMTVACKKFQSLEEEHLSQLRLFTLRLVDSHETGEMELYREYKKLKERMETFPVEKLISMFAQLKTTGKRKPELMQFSPIEIDAIQLSRSGSLASFNDVSQDKQTTAPTKKEKKKKKSKKDSGTNDAPETTPPKDENVDEEGYTIRPENADKIAKFSDDDSHHSDSESESDFEDEAEKRIQGLKIKEQAITAAASVDELSEVVKKIKLEAPPTTGMKRAGSTHSLDTQSTSNIPQLTKTSPAGSQSLYNQPIDVSSATTVDHQPPTLAPNQSLPSFPTTGTPWEASFNASLPPPVSSSSSWATFITPEKTLDTQSVLSPILTPSDKSSEDEGIKINLSDTSSLDNGVRQSSPQIGSRTSSPLPNSLLPPPPGSTRRRGFEGGGHKSEPSSPNLPIRGISPVQSQKEQVMTNPTQRRSLNQRPISATPLTSPSPLATTTHQSAVQNTSSSSLNTSLTSGPVKQTSGSILPIAIAFQETCNAIFKGSDLSKTIVKVTGQMDFSFPSNALSLLSSHEPLQFSLTDLQNVTKILHNQNLLIQEKEGVYIFQMDKLSTHLQQIASKSPLPFHNVQALKYEVIHTKSIMLPLQLTSFWKCEPTNTTFRLDYTYTPNVFPVATKPNMTNITVSLTVGGGVTKVDSEPSGTWSADKNMIVWKLPDISASNDDTSTLKSKFQVSSGPTTPSPALIQFVCDGSTLSGINFSLESTAYKISLRKDKCSAGKYMAEPAK